MRIIGLTGGIASGKSFVSKCLQELGALIIDADEIARQVVQAGSPALQKIAAEFGQEVIAPDGSLDRKKMADIVFNSEIARTKLNNIVHPGTKAEILRLVEVHKKKDKLQAIIIDAPLLIESGLYKYVDEVWVVGLKEELQIERLVSRDKITPEAALKRIRMQMPLLEKLKYADQVIDNNGSREETLQQIKALWQKII